MKKNKIFLACDSNNIHRIKKIIRDSKNNEIFTAYKFGLEFINSKNGRKFISNLKNEIIFGDYKLHDIPNTCAATIKSVRDLKFTGKTKIVGVTILTSLDNDAVREIGFNKDVKRLVMQQAKLASKANLDAIVCSAQEAKIVKKVFKKEIITPGIRFSSNINDQKRTLNPKQAYRNGADWLVIGRDITKGNIKKNVQTLVDHLNQ